MPIEENRFLGFLSVIQWETKPSGVLFEVAGWKETTGVADRGGVRPPSLQVSTSRQLDCVGISYVLTLITQSRSLNVAQLFSTAFSQRISWQVCRRYNGKFTPGQKLQSVFSTTSSGVEATPSGSSVYRQTKTSFSLGHFINFKNFPISSWMFQLVLCFSGSFYSLC